MTKPSTWPLPRIQCLAAALGLLAPIPTATAGILISGPGVHTITASGEYHVTGTIGGIVVTADNVSIDLSQGTVDCSTEPPFRLGIHAPGDRFGVSVNGGTVQKCNVGILMGDPFVSGGGGSDHDINGVTVQDALTGGGTIFNGDGILLNDSTGSRVRNNFVTGVGGSLVSVGIRLLGGSDNQVRQNTVASVTTGTLPPWGILLQDADNTDVDNNMISGVPGQGLGAAGEAVGNLFRCNASLTNTTDVRDDTDPCQNKWISNTFSTVSEAVPGCIANTDSVSCPIPEVPGLSPRSLLALFVMLGMALTAALVLQQSE